MKDQRIFKFSPLRKFPLVYLQFISEFALENRLAVFFLDLIRVNTLISYKTQTFYFLIR